MYLFGDLALFHASYDFVLALFEEEPIFRQVDQLPFDFFGLVVEEPLVIPQPDGVNDASRSQTSYRSVTGPSLPSTGMWVCSSMLSLSQLPIRFKGD